MVVAFGVFIARAPIAEFQFLKDSRLFEQLDGAVDRGQRDARVNAGGAGVDFLHIGGGPRPRR